VVDQTPEVDQTIEQGRGETYASDGPCTNTVCMTGKVSCLARVGAPGWMTSTHWKRHRGSTPRRWSARSLRTRRRASATCPGRMNER